MLLTGLAARRVSKPNPGVLVDWSHPLSRGLAALWVLNEGTGLPVDLISGTQATSNSMAWGGSPHGTALLGNGTSSGVLVTTPAVSYSGPYTVAALSAPAASFARQILAATNGYVLSVNSNGNNELNIFQGAANTTVSSASNVVDGGWHLFAAGQSATTANGVQFYRDGIPIGTATQAVFPAVTNWTTALGTNGTGTTAWLKGGLALYAAWNRALSGPEHRILAQGPWQVFGRPYANLWVQAKPVAAADGLGAGGVPSSNAQRPSGGGHGLGLGDAASVTVRGPGIAASGLGLGGQASATSHGPLTGQSGVGFSDSARHHTMRSALYVADGLGLADSAFGQGLGPNAVDPEDALALADAGTATRIPAGAYAADILAFEDLAPVGVSAGDGVAWADATASALNYGRYRPGDRLRLHVHTPDPPDVPVVAVILDANAATVTAVTLAPTSPDRTVHGAWLPIVPPFATGTFVVAYYYLVGGVATLRTAGFEVVPGGDPGGSIISLGPIDRPEARALIAQLDSGRLVVGSDPRLASSIR